jgi:hypothetical protein
MNCSAAASTRGWRAVEPTAVTLPERFALEEEESDDALESVVVLEPLPPQPTRPRPSVEARVAPARTKLRRDML